jgi:hypothetical protein
LQLVSVPSLGPDTPVVIDPAYQHDPEARRGNECEDYEGEGPTIRINFVGESIRQRAQCTRERAECARERDAGCEKGGGQVSATAEKEQQAAKNCSPDHANQG